MPIRQNSDTHSFNRTLPTQYGLDRARQVCQTRQNRLHDKRHGPKPPIRVTQIKNTQSGYKFTR